MVSKRIRAAGGAGESRRLDRLQRAQLSREHLGERDAYRDEEPYRVAWSLPAGKRLHRVLKGRSINSVAVTPSADLIAISVASRLNIGRIEDAVYVLRASDGAEVFRQYLPLYTRTQVLFPTNETLLYSTGEKTLLVRIVR